MTIFGVNKLDTIAMLTLLPEFANQFRILLLQEADKIVTLRPYAVLGNYVSSVLLSKYVLSSVQCPSIFTNCVRNILMLQFFVASVAYTVHSRPTHGKRIEGRGNLIVYLIAYQICLPEQPLSPLLAIA